MAEIQQQRTEYQTGFAPQIAPYAERLLGGAEGTIFQYQRDPSGKIVMDDTGMPVIKGFQPYQQYQGERFAQFTPLQQQAFAGAQAMQAAPQLADAAALAGTAGLQALGYGGYRPMQYSPMSFTQPGMAQAYMNPYMDAVQQQLQRQADIQRSTIGAQAAKSGMFGGARTGLMESQLNADLMRQQQQAQAQAFGQAQQQFNQEQQARQAAAQLGEQSRQYGAGLGLQGLQTAMQGASQLGQLGQTQFGQNLALNQLQAQYGQQQQQKMQDILGAQYQDFLNFQNYPYKQLGFMSDILRGAPLMQTGSTVYGQPPSTAATLAGIGALGKGFGMFAKGGAVHDAPAGLADLAIYNMGR